MRNKPRVRNQWATAKNTIILSNCRKPQFCTIFSACFARVIRLFVENLDTQRDGATLAEAMFILSFNAFKKTIPDRYSDCSGSDYMYVGARTEIH